MRFSDIHGLEETKTHLIQGVKNNHVAHAQLFAGIEGSAVLPMALAYATLLNCEHPLENDACGECPSCTKNIKFVHPDTHFIFPVSGTKDVAGPQANSSAFMQSWRTFLLNNPYGNIEDWAEAYGGENKQAAISTKESRGIIEKLSLKAFEGKHKIMLIWLPELMHPSGANAILKILEEPSEGTVFILVTTQPDRLLATIRSRTQMLRVPSFTDTELVSLLKSENGIDDAKAAQIANLADGSLRHAIELKNEVEEDSHEMFRGWMRKCFNNDFASLVDLSEKFSGLNKFTQKSMLVYGINILRESLVANLAEGGLLRVIGEERNFAANFNKVVDVEKVSSISTQLSESHYYLERNANPKILFMNLSIQIAKIFNKK